MNLFRVPCIAILSVVAIFSVQATGASAQSPAAEGNDTVQASTISKQRRNATPGFVSAVPTSPEAKRLLEGLADSSRISL